MKFEKYYLKLINPVRIWNLNYIYKYIYIWGHIIEGKAQIIWRIDNYLHLILLLCYIDGEEDVYGWASYMFVGYY